MARPSPSGVTGLFLIGWSQSMYGCGRVGNHPLTVEPVVACGGNPHRSLAVHDRLRRLDRLPRLPEVVRVLPVAAADVEQAPRWRGVEFVLAAVPRAEHDPPRCGAVHGDAVLVVAGGRV